MGILTAFGQPNGSSLQPIFSPPALILCQFLMGVEPPAGHRDLVLFSYRCLFE